MEMFRQTIALALCAVMAATGCASASGPRIAQDSAPPIDRAVLADYVERIPAGSRVRVERTTGGTLRGTLLKSGATSLTMQRNTRVPETPIEVPFNSITRVTLDNQSSTARTVGIAIATGVGATFGVLLLLAAIFSD
jgi:hypothetical protein